MENRKNKVEIQEISDLLQDFATSLMGAGTHTSRVDHIVSRIADTFGYDLNMTIFQKTVMMTITDQHDTTVRNTSVKRIKPLALNFKIVSELSKLSWDIYDQKLSLTESRERYIEIVSAPRMSRWWVLVLVACANASFCRLFSGDGIAMALVFAGTLVGFFIRQEMMNRHLNHLLVFIVSSFVASMIAGIDYFYGLGSTPDIALATSVLYLIPGVPLINSAIDLIEGHVVVGITRLVNAGILIICIALGLLSTLMILGIDNL
ncbi:MAG: threonine/serine exporter family protein [Bacteroidales bacterium]|nr:threonine/serine exporter family protein [Bacteroidales bacterium]